MIGTIVTVATPFIAAALAYTAALRAWRRQQRRDVYAQFVAHASVVLEALDRWEMSADLGEGVASRRWGEFVTARRPLVVDISQMRLVAPARVNDAAKVIHADATEFEETAEASDWTHAQGIEWRSNSRGMSWYALNQFIEVARDDLAVQAWPRRLSERRLAQRRDKAMAGPLETDDDRERARWTV